MEMRLSHSSDSAIATGRILRWFGLCLLTAAAAASLFAANAHAYIYWANWNTSAFGGNIWRANLDGTGATSFIGVQLPCGVAVNGQHIYWADLTSRSIGRANIDGSGIDPNFIRLPAAPCGVAVNGSQIWWANLGQPDPADSSIGRANLDGSGVVVRMFTQPELPCGVAVDSSFVYWAENYGPGRSIWRAGLDGTPPPSQLVSSDPDEACWPTVSGSRLYWWARATGIMSSNLDGTDPTTVVGASGRGGLGIIEGKVYWGDPLGRTIGRANLDGSSPEPGFMNTAGPQAGVAVDSGVPSNQIWIGKLRRNKAKGTASLTVRVAAPGVVSVSGIGVVKKRRVPVTKAIYLPGKVHLPVRPKGQKKMRLDRRGKVRLRLRIYFVPTGGIPNSRAKKVKLFMRNVRLKARRGGAVLSPGDAPRSLSSRVTSERPRLQA